MPQLRVHLWSDDRPGRTTPPCMAHSSFKPSISPSLASKDEQSTAFPIPFYAYWIIGKLID